MRRIVTLLVVALGTWGCSGDEAKIAFSTSTAAGTTGSGTHSSSTGTHGSTGTHSSTGTGTASSTDTGSTGSDTSTDSSSSDSSSSDSSSSSSSSSASSVASSTTGGGTTSSSSTSSGGSIGGCFEAGSFVGLGHGSQCCSGITDTDGNCYEPPAPTTSSSSGSTGGASCGSSCLHSGFHCENGQCVLNGNHGALQVTLEWANTPRTQADLDLHLVMPAGSCSLNEIYFSSRTCGSLSLDLDANAGCFQSTGPGAAGDDTENIIIAPGATPPSGQYIVRVTDYSNSCSGSLDIPYRVTIRTPTIPSTTITGVFHSNSAHGGGAGSGVEITRFTLP